VLVQGTRARHLLTVVQQQQYLLLTQCDLELMQQGPISLFLQAKRLSNGRKNQFGISHRSQRHEPCPVREALRHLGCHLQAQARFADASRTRQGEEAHAFTQEVSLDGGHFLFSSNERSGLDGQIVRGVVERLEGRKVSGKARDDELEQTMGVSQIFEALFSQVAQAHLLW